MEALKKKEEEDLMQLELRRKQKEKEEAEKEEERLKKEMEIKKLKELEVKNAVENRRKREEEEYLLEQEALKNETTLFGLNSQKIEKKTMEGIMKKKSPSALAGWQSRYCVLSESSILSYYGNEKDYRSGKAAKGNINMNDVSPDQRKYMITNGSSKLNIQVSDRLYEFDCGDSNTALRWYSAIVTHFQ
eukprot:TRINITY_DN63236_c1_g1_i1.p1 TRINITY_DN63236_c1_g1~~TRINITY_DN63236_c1_g1_i1.p1  ORF type:complete len:209 (+),score=26.95 TRINITY_DN63236_c1_g1_i1:61-627(+)